MYRALKAFYLISICLTYKKRRKLANMFILSLRSHRTELNDVIKAFVKPIQKLNRGTQLKVNDNLKIVCAFAITFLDDMSQQANNVGFMRYSVRIEYRICYCSKKERDNLDFDTIINDRYYWKTQSQRDYMIDLNTIAEVRI